MQTTSRIPKLTEASFHGALLCFLQLQCEGLLFHLKDEWAWMSLLQDALNQYSVLAGKNSGK